MISHLAGAGWPFPSGDPTLLGWATASGYLLAGVMSFVHARHTARRSAGQVASLQSAIWFGLGCALCLLGVNKELDLHTNLIRLVRTAAIAQGWYEQRHVVQLWFVAAATVAGSGMLLATAGAFRHDWRRALPLLLGLLLILRFLAVRTASILGVPLPQLSHLTGGLRLNGLLEIAGIGILLAALISQLFVPRRRPAGRLDGPNARSRSASAQPAVGTGAWLSAPRLFPVALVFLAALVFLPFIALNGRPMAAMPIETNPQWTLQSSADGDLPAPSQNTQQTASLILDIDNDGVNDFVIGARRGPGPSLVWFKRVDDTWQRAVIEPESLNIEAGGAYHDIDGDGDLDIVMGGDNTSNEMWWWENPYPDFDADSGWTRRTIKNSGGPKHHDQLFGDFDGDGQAELAFWNQGPRTLFLAEIPADPYTAATWSYTDIYTRTGSESEGLTQADMDGDGLGDLVGGGGWFKYVSDGVYERREIDDEQRFTRAAAGQLIAGGRPEVVFVVGDGVGRLRLYTWDGSTWIGRDLVDEEIDHGHSLQLVDLDQDGALDIFYAEMRLNGDNADARMEVLYGDGAGNFTAVEIASGYGNHESRVADLDGDGDLDILGKPYNWQTPRVDIWLNDNDGTSGAGNEWCRHVVDANRPWRSVFVTWADLNGDDLADIVAGGWWYKNPGAADGEWTRTAIGDPLNNFAAVYDFDDDGDQDILGTTGQNMAVSNTFVWAQNDGAGNFAILDNIQEANGDFLQGVAIDRFDPDSPMEVALSWHMANQGIQMLAIPADPSRGEWSWRLAAETSQDEALSAGDIDNDGDVDLLLGTQWLRNRNGAFEALTLANADEDPDRNRLADINNDGRLDAVVGFEAINSLGQLTWYEQPETPEATWTEHLIAEVVGPMSVDVADMDQDGDLDVVVGEHNLANSSDARLLIYENGDGIGNEWIERLVYTGDEHHDGAHVTDIDGDGDYDIVSIGWGHPRVLLYENRDQPCEPTFNAPTNESEPDSSALPSSAATPTATASVSANQPIPTPTAGLLPTVTAVGQLLPTRCAAGAPLVHYTFQAGRGATVTNRAVASPPLDLIIESGAVTWLDGGGIDIQGPALITSGEPATALIDAIKASGELTVEAWIEPASIDQAGPARIVTLSDSATRRNFTLGQGRFNRDPRDVFDVRVRTTDERIDDNGEPSIMTPPNTAATKRTHLAYAHTADGQSAIYVDGQAVVDNTTAGTLENWDSAYPLSLANEVGGNRPWTGKLYSVAIYDCALSAKEIAARYTAALSASD